MRTVARVLAVTGALASLLLAHPAAAQLPAPGAEKSELRVVAGNPGAGDGTVAVEYRATPTLAGEERLVLRARLFRASPQVAAHHARLGELTRTAGGAYRGSFRMPDSVVYAVLAVEDPRGETVDHHPSAWDHVVPAADGRPLLAGLLHRVGYHAEVDSRSALAIARDAVRLYPDSVAGWLRLFRAESALAPRSARDSLAAAHRTRLRALEERLRGAAPTPEAMADVMWYARVVGDTTAAREWAERLIREHPAHTAAVQQRVFEISRASRGDSRALLAGLERLGEEVDFASPQLAITGFMTARKLGDAEAVRRWGERFDLLDPVARHVVTQAFVTFPTLRAEAMRRLRRELASLNEEAREVERPLGRTVAEQKREEDRLRGRYLGELGKSLVATGQVEAALDTLERAVAATWSPELFRATAEAKLALGDTAGALPVLARVAADPGTPAAFADSVRSRVAPGFDEARWRAWVDAARREMREHVWQASVEQPLRGSVRLADAHGTSAAWAATHEAPTVVAFWSRYCTPSSLQLAQFQRAFESLRAAGVRVATITSEKPSAGLAEFLREKGLSFPVLHDVHGDAERAFENRATPRYFVLDPSGRIRFASYSPQDLVRQAAVLRADEPRP